ncbi:MAG: PilN domain-containing protein [bacterium]|nr:PilN domain-containing protein [bacterium]
MINLLPPQEKKENLSRKKLKLILIFEIGILLFLLSNLFILFSVKVYLGGEIDSEKINFSQRQKEVDVAAISNFQTNIKNLNENLGEIKSFYEKQVSLAGVFETISENLPQGSYLTSFSFHQEPELRKVSLTGYAPKRDDLLAFKSSLEGSRVFANIDFPPINWVSPENIEFYLNLEIK